MGNVLKYNDYDIEMAEAEQEASEQSGQQFMKLKPGKNVVRILPPIGGARSPFRVTYQHYINMPGLNGKSKSVICARLEAKKPCLVCQKVEELRSSQSKVDQKAADELFARRRVFCNVIDRDDEEFGPKVMAFGKSVHEQLLALRTDSKGGGNFAHPEEGFDIIIERKGSGKNDTEYTVRGDRNSSPMGPSVEVMQEWIDTQHDLNQFARLSGDDDVQGYLDGGAEEEEQPRQRRQLPQTTSRSVPSTGARARAEARDPSPRTTSRGRRTAEDDAIDVEAEVAD